MTEPVFVRIEQIRSEFPLLRKDHERVAELRNRLLEGDRTPVIVRQLKSGAYEVLEASYPRYLAHIYEDFEHVPVFVAPENN